MWKIRCKKVKFCLDFWIELWYYMQAVSRRMARFNHRNNFVETWKKFLTKNVECARMSELTTQWERLYLVNWIMWDKLNTLDNLKNGLFKIIRVRMNETANENSWVKFARANYLKDDFKSKDLRYNFLRVWSWLRTNAGGVPNTCKSNGRGELAPWVSGERVSNAWGTCLPVGDNSWKRLLIPHNTLVPHGTEVKA